MFFTFQIKIRIFCPIIRFATHHCGKHAQVPHFQRLLQHPLDSDKSFFLFGPRGTGKTTWLKTHVPDALFVNLLQSEFYNPLSAEPGG